MERLGTYASLELHGTNQDGLGAAPEVPKMRIVGTLRLGRPTRNETSTSHKGRPTVLMIDG